MKYLQSEVQLGNNECAGDALQSAELVKLHLAELQQQIDALPADATTDERLHLTLDRGYALLEANLFEEAWRVARTAFDEAVREQLWLRAVEACDVLFQSEQVLW